MRGPQGARPAPGSWSAAEDGDGQGGSTLRPGPPGAHPPVKRSHEREWKGIRGSVNGSVASIPGTERN